MCLDFCCLFESGLYLRFLKHRFFFFFWSVFCPSWDLSFWPGMELRPSAVKAQCPYHWPPGISVRFFWLSWVKIFSCSIVTLGCSMWDLVPCRGFRPRLPALDSQFEVCHWTTKKVSLRFLKCYWRDFSGGPVVKECRSTGLIPGLGIKILHAQATWCGQK